MTMIRPLLIALQFLTRLPVTTSATVDDRDVGRSLLWYPLVGLLIGLTLAALARTLGSVPVELRAALILGAWVLITGALHLDGLADSADAWLGGLGDRERTLAIMKDPCSGPGAVVALVMVLIVKFTALESLLATGDWKPLVLAPLLGRMILPLLFITTPYVRHAGLGTAMARHLPRRTATAVVLATGIAVSMFTGKPGNLSLVVAATTFVLLRAMMLRRLDGTTGDTAGAMVELVETAVLTSIAIA
ncbi:MAG: adenosylcobinamide-GDP ribazoletransferase [Sulfuricaulis sp.]